MLHAFSHNFWIRPQPLPRSFPYGNPPWWFREKNSMEFPWNFHIILPTWNFHGLHTHGITVIATHEFPWNFHGIFISFCPHEISMVCTPWVHEKPGVRSMGTPWIFHEITMVGTPWVSMALSWCVNHGNFTWAKWYENSMEIPWNFFYEITMVDFRKGKARYNEGPVYLSRPETYMSIIMLWSRPKPFKVVSKSKRCYSQCVLLW